MKNKLKYGCIVILLVSAILVTLIQIGKILNVSETKEVSQNVEDVVASAASEPPIFGGNLQNGANANEMYLFRRDTFCAGFGWSLPRRLTYHENDKTYVPDGGVGAAQQYVEWHHEKTVDIPQSVAYARANGATDVELQDVVWASWQWQGTSYDGSTCLIGVDTNLKTNPYDGTIRGRSNQFCNFIYRALYKDNKEYKLGLNCTTSSTSLEVLVDQSNKTYTVGPYTISFQHQSWEGVNGCEGTTMGSLVYNEIIGKNKGETSSNQFCSGSIAAYAKYTDGSKGTLTDIEIIDANGNKITKFPKFGQKFYVRAKQKNDAKQIDIIKPLVKINFMTPYSGIAKSYKSYKITYNMLQDNASIIQSVVNVDPDIDILGGWGEDGRIIYYNGNAEFTDNWLTLEKIAAAKEKMIKDIKDEIYKKGKEWGIDRDTMEVEIKAESGIVINEEFIQNDGDIHIQTFREHEESYDFFCPQCNMSYKYKTDRAFGAKHNIETGHTMSVEPDKTHYRLDLQLIINHSEEILYTTHITDWSDTLEDANELAKNDIMDYLERVGFHIAIRITRSNSNRVYKKYSATSNIFCS